MSTRCVIGPSLASDPATTPTATQEPTVADDGVTTDRWALCGECDRWFYCERGTDATRSAPTCPVCGAPPLALCDRAVAPGASRGSDAGIA